MTDAELTIFNAGQRLFDDASEPVSILIHDEIWPAEWLTPHEKQAAIRLGESERWRWLRKGWFEALWRDAQPERDG